MSACTTANLGHAYDSCVGETRIAYKYIRTDECDPSLSEPAFFAELKSIEVPCHVECVEGEILPFAESTCESCAEGHYSIGSGDLHDSFHVPLEGEALVPSGFSTECSLLYGGNCDSWIMDNESIYSGDNLDHYNVDSNLYYTAVITEETGSLIFEYMVSAENCDSRMECDGFRFYHNGELKIPFTSAESWSRAEFVLSPGINTFKWRYTTDYSVHKGQDRAAIRNIQIKGTANNVETCGDCPAGMYQDQPTQSGCKRCQWNEISVAPSSTACSPCALGTYAPFRSSVCLNRPVTKTEDYQRVTAVGSPVKDGSGTWQCTYEQTLNAPSLAPDHIFTDGTAKQNITVPCTCSAGKEFNASGECVKCAPGTYKPENGPEPCTALDTDHIAQHGIVLSTPDELLPADEGTGTAQLCISGCADVDGAGFWQKFDDGIGLGTSGQESDKFSSILAYWFDIVPGQDALVEIDYRMLRYQLPGYLEEAFTAEIDIQGTASDDEDFRTFAFVNLPASEDIKNTVSIDIPWNSDKFTKFRAIVYVQKLSDDANIIPTMLQSGNNLEKAQRGFFLIDELRFINTAMENDVPIGQSICDPGHEVSSDFVCEPCKAGTISTDGTKCQLCSEPNTYNPYEGRTACIECGAGTTPDSDRKDCSSKESSPETWCQYTHEEHEYDFRPLDSGIAGDYFVGLYEEHNYYVSMCSSAHSEDSNCGSQGRSFVCQVNNEDADESKRNWSLGDTWGYRYNTTMNAVSIVLTDGNGSNCPTGHTRNSEINMICNMTLGYGTPISAYELEPESEEGSCDYYFNWETKYACPVCTEGDLEAVKSPCIDGEVRVDYVSETCWNRDFTSKNLVLSCNPKAESITVEGIKVALDAATNESYKTDFVQGTESAEIVVVTENAKSSIKVFGQTATSGKPVSLQLTDGDNNFTIEITAEDGTVVLYNIVLFVEPTPFEMPVYVYVIIALLVVVLAGVGGFCYWKNRKLTYKYSRLLANEAPNELTESAYDTRDLPDTPDDLDQDDFN